MAKNKTFRQISTYKPTRVTKTQVRKAASILSVRNMGRTGKASFGRKSSGNSRSRFGK